ncbi:MAG: bifunctional phosphopantothenoylcysteine decarboxylase/phosphopantothenate--cysteine ligase CoaBC [Myxococcaceae bacterium]
MDLRYLKARRIALGVGGGIAAYKACDLARELMRAGATVRVAMTDAAQKFVTALTFQALTAQPVLTDYFEPSQDANYGHLDLARWAELFVIAPATADLLARVKAGMANDAVTTSLLAFRGPVLLAPAMNVAMWENEQTQRNIAALSDWPRFKIVPPEVGLLADGEVGAGRLAQLPVIVAAAASMGQVGDLYGKRVLITAGPTREAIDPVRFVTNASSGKMGLALAQDARARGADVTVVLGPVNGGDSDGIEVVKVVTAEEMAREVLARVEDTDFFVASAAVSDYRPESASSQKVKKSDGPETLTFVRTPDVLLDAARKVAGRSPKPVLVGFAAETEKLLEHAREKLQRKGLDVIVANDVTEPGAGFEVDTNKVTVLTKNGTEISAEGTKREVAAKIWDIAVELIPSRPPEPS